MKSSAKPIVIMHGWSDDYQSLQNLATMLRKETQRSVQQINLANYITLDDDIHLHDLACAMQQAWQTQGLPTQPYSVDVIVHSLGGLVLRDWLTRFYTPQNAPVKHLVMLAPANFGSPLAHKGRALIGRILKGRRSHKPFQTGVNILRALEMASPYTWQLAMQDRFAKANYYGPNKILCTVLTGSSGFKGLASVVNEPGSDGTVYAACANMNAVMLHIDFTQDTEHPRFGITRAKGKTAFALLREEDHASILNNQRGFASPLTQPFILQALAVSDADFASWCQRLAKHTQQVTQQATDKVNTHSFQNTVCLLQDQFQHAIEDYFLEFTAASDAKQRVAEFFHQQVIEDVHPYEQNPAYRSLMININQLQRLQEKPNLSLNLRISALPDIHETQLVGYQTYDVDRYGVLQFTPPQIKQIFQAHRSLLVKITIQREQAAKLFAFK
jgi:hypothetical protein